MKYQTHNQKEVDVNMTHRVGEVVTTYAALVKAFGKPSKNFDDYKCDAEWDIEFQDGTVATIYNYKNGKNYLGKEGVAKTKITDWNIGGHDEKAAQLVKQALKEGN
jgi:major membrane immunogen (membrane-anchored lipoprotein)